MNFISLNDVLDSIAARIKQPQPSKQERKFPNDEFMISVYEFWDNVTPQINAAYRISAAASKLHQAISDDRNASLMWKEVERASGDKMEATGPVIYEGLSLLKYIVGWGKRETKRHADHVTICDATGLQPHITTVGGDSNEGMTPARSFLRPREIGFARKGVASFLDTYEILHNLEIVEDIEPILMPILTSPSTAINKVTRNKLRTNSLDAPIIKAIAMAKSLTPAAVFLQLRELALGEEKPFTGVVVDGVLFYTDDNDNEKKITKELLRKRLKSHVPQNGNGG